jgi:hypothetical protein
MTEAEASWNVCRAYEIGLQQAIEGGEGGPLGHSGDRSQQFGLERFTGDRRRLEHPPRVVG